MGDDKNSIADLLTLATTSENIIFTLSICLRELTSSSTRFNPCFPLRKAYLLL